MTTTSETKIDLVKKLYQVIQERKQLEQTEKALKEEVRVVMGDQVELVADDVVVTREEASRESIDKEALVEEMGKDFVAKFTKVSTFEKMQVKKKK